MKDLIITLLLVILVILIAVIDATLTIQEERQSAEDWTIENLYNPTGKWCFLDQEHPLPVDCQFNFDWETD